MSDDDYGAVTRFGFEWGPIEVTRACLLPGGRRVVQVKAGTRTLDICVSATGRSIRVFEDGDEWQRGVRDAA